MKSARYAPILAVAMGLAVLSAWGAAAAAWRDGTFRGTARGYVDDIAVDVTIAQGQITEVTIAEHRESRPRTALEDIPRAIVAAQGVDGVDAVTGATVTSRGVREAARQALKQAE